MGNVLIKLLFLKCLLLSVVFLLSQSHSYWNVFNLQCGGLRVNAHLYSYCYYKGWTWIKTLKCLQAECRLLLMPSEVALSSSPFLRSCAAYLQRSAHKCLTEITKICSTTARAALQSRFSYIVILIILP